jgi:hypothetical protein
LNHSASYEKIKVIEEKITSVYKNIRFFFSKLKYFLISLGITGLFIIFTVGFISVERKIETFKNEDSVFEYSLKENNKFIKIIFMGKELKVYF